MLRHLVILLRVWSWELFFIYQNSACVLSEGAVKQVRDSSLRSCLGTVSFTTAAYDKASPKPHAWAEAGLNSYVTGAAAPQNRLVEVGSAPVFFMALPALCCRQEPFPVLPTSSHCADFFIPLCS